MEPAPMPVLLRSWPDGHVAPPPDPPPHCEIPAEIQRTPVLHIHNHTGKTDTPDPMRALNRFFVLGNSTPYRSPKFDGNDNKKPVTVKGLNVGEIGKQFFGDIPPYQLFDRFVELYELIPDYLQQHNTCNYLYREGLAHAQFFMKTFLLYVRFCQPRRRIPSRKGESALSQPESSKPPSVEITLTDAQEERFCHIVARIDFSFKFKIWSLIDSTGLISVHQNPILLKAIRDALGEKQVSFCALRFGFHRYQSDFDAETDLQTLLMLGKVSGVFVEDFLARKSEPFRVLARKTLSDAEQWALDVNAFNEARDRLTDSTQQRVLSFEEFSENMGDLMCELRKEMPRCNLISKPWAYTAFSKALRKRYATLEWGVEHINDLMLCLLRQRPEMRAYMVRELRERYQDQRAAKFWHHIDVNSDSERARMQMLGAQLEARRKHKENRAFARQPPGLSVEPEKPSLDHLELSADTEIFVIDNAMKLAFIGHRIKIVRAEQKPDQSYDVVVGLDAEWSPYVLTSRASILQLAVSNMVFIIDLDQIDDQTALCAFMNELFLDAQVLKIGFKFAEDLTQIRRRLPNCNSLYEPESLVCINKIVEYLFRLSKEKNVAVEQFISLDKVDEEEEEETAAEEEEGHADLNESADPNSDSSPPPTPTRPKKKQENERDNIKQVFKNMGLSALCAAVLGKDLDKTEQCSVWDRRPLRQSQIRYAALDANVMLTLFELCRQWAASLGVSMEQVCAAQTTISIPLPLFFDKTQLQSYQRDHDHQSSGWDEAT